MKYLLQVRFEDARKAVDALSTGDRDAIADEYRSIRRTPGVLDGNQLEPADNATTVRVLDGGTVAATGAIDGTMDGYYLHEAPDRATAVALAARIPAARMGGTVEVRAVLDG
jgi:hypothetical protein